MGNILQEIMEYKRLEVSRRRRERSLSSLTDSAQYERERVSLRAALERSPHYGIIAEFKRRSPSQKDINLTADPRQVVPAYQAAGAAGVSVLTDERFFGAQAGDFAAVRERVSLPLLRKDFICDEYQIFEARSLGADAILLIAACLTPSQLEELALAAKENGMEVLCELHSTEEIGHLNASVDIVGVNNRALQTFSEDLGHSQDLAQLLPNAYLPISESAIRDPQQVVDLRRIGYQGFLIGTHFMLAKEPGRACADFISSLHQLSPSPKEAS